jgi:hypothetical protein
VQAVHKQVAAYGNDTDMRQSLELKQQPCDQGLLKDRDILQLAGTVQGRKLWTSMRKFCLAAFIDALTTAPREAFPLDSYEAGTTFA